MFYLQLDCGIAQTYMFHALMAKSFVMLDGNVDFLLQDFDTSKKKLKVKYLTIGQETMYGKSNF